MKEIISRKETGIPVLQGLDGHTFEANGYETHNCCRLRLDLRELRKKSGGLFGAGDNTGSNAVITLNMPRLGYLSKTKEEFYRRLSDLMDIAKKGLIQKRLFIEEQLEAGLYPYMKRYIGNFNNFFLTFGIVGMNECCLNLLHKDIGTKAGKDFTLEVMDFMRGKISDYQEKTGYLFNLEGVPAESTAYRLAKHDKERYPDIITAGTAESPYYTNSANLPVNYTDDPWVVIRHQEAIQNKFTGGTVIHFFLGEQIHDWTKCRDFVKKVMTETSVPYITMSPTYSYCMIHGYINGDSHGVCPKCREEQLAEYQKRLAQLEQKKTEIEKSQPDSAQ